MYNENKTAFDLLAGDGIEIGALHKPLLLDSNKVTRIRYVDRIATQQANYHYPELKGNIITPDIIDDAQSLSSIEDSSLDFVAALDVMEHLEDPIAFLKTMGRVLKVGGKLFLRIPNCCGFDYDRDITTLNHLLLDHKTRGRYSKISHYMEWAYLSLGLDESCAEDLMKIGYAIHFHVWNIVKIKELLDYTRNNFVPLICSVYEDTGIYIVGTLD
jgi:SAM-dependent methyltransferase